MARPQSKQQGETRPVWKEYEREVARTFGWIRATGWKPAVVKGSQVAKS